MLMFAYTYCEHLPVSHSCVKSCCSAAPRLFRVQLSTRCYMGSVHLSLSANAVKSPNSASVFTLVAERVPHQDPHLRGGGLSSPHS